MTEEQKEKYANFLDKVSEILGLNKPVDILRLCAVTDEYLKPIEKRIAELEKENAELKVKVGLSIECDKAEKNGELCLGYGGDEDEPCEQCKNCIKCECGYYQLRETEKDEQLTKAKNLLLRFIELKNKPCFVGHSVNMLLYENIRSEAEQFLKEVDF